MHESFSTDTGERKVKYGNDMVTKFLSCGHVKILGVIIVSSKNYIHFLGVKRRIIEDIKNVE